MQKRANARVTAILVLNGLPRLHTGAILAHELMHAFLHTQAISGLPPQVEEGLCQLLAYLWIERQHTVVRSFESFLVRMRFGLEFAAADLPASSAVRRRWGSVASALPL